MNSVQLAPVYILTLVILVSWTLFALSFLLPDRRAFRRFQKIRKQDRVRHAINHDNDSNSTSCICGKTFASMEQAEGHIRRMKRYKTMNRMPHE